ncbi:hypothetical protein QE418_002275 [Microbacterium testaceum]|nr:hypothetical protein [Microbacterium testaceum]
MSAVDSAGGSVGGGVGLRVFRPGGAAGSRHPGPSGGVGAGHAGCRGLGTACRRWTPRDGRSGAVSGCGCFGRAGRWVPGIRDRPAESGRDTPVSTGGGRRVGGGLRVRVGRGRCRAAGSSVGRGGGFPASGTVRRSRGGTRRFPGARDGVSAVGTAGRRCSSGTDAVTPAHARIHPLRCPPPAGRKPRNGRVTWVHGDDGGARHPGSQRRRDPPRRRHGSGRAGGSVHARAGDGRPDGGMGRARAAGLRRGLAC